MEVEINLMFIYQVIHYLVVLDGVKVKTYTLFGWEADADAELSWPGGLTC